MRSTFFSVLCTLLFVSALQAQTRETAGQFVFSVKPELLGFAGASFGYKFPGEFVLSAGIDYFHLGTTVDIETTYLNISGPNPPSPSSDKADASLNVYNFTLTGRYFLLHKAAIAGYILGEVSKPLVSGKFEENGKSNEDVQAVIDNLNFWGVKAAFGAEYFFSDNFSIGGEFGLRMLFVGVTETNDQPYYYTYFDPQTQQYRQGVGTERTSTDVSFNFSATYSTLTLNYYF